MARSARGERRNRRGHLRLALLVLAACLACACSGQSSASVREAEPRVIVTEPTVDPSLSGWVRGDDGELRYYDPSTHRLYAGWLDEEGVRLYIDGATGQARTGWLELDGKRYWLDDGTRATRGALLANAWLELDGKRYWLGEDGAMATGWLEQDGRTYYLDSEGASRTGLIDDGSGKRWWLNDDGTLASHEWIEIDGVYQAFDDDGSLVTFGEVIPEGDAARLAALSSRQQAVLDACKSTPWPGKALCALWVSNVFANAGEPSVPGDACDLARAWCHSSELSELEPGMIIAVESHSRTENGKIWGHICIYIGDGLICDSGTYGIRTSSLGSWLAWFGDSQQPRWGWANGIDLSD